MTKEERKAYDKARWPTARVARDERRRANPEGTRAYRAKYYQDNIEKERTWTAEYRKNNPDKRRAFEANRRASQLQATPPWAHHGVINFIYALAQHQGHVVDHIVPLKGKTVCGLHWERNLQLLTAKENSKKGNSLTELASYLAI